MVLLRGRIVRKWDLPRCATRVYPSGARGYITVVVLLVRESEGDGKMEKRGAVRCHADL